MLFTETKLKGAWLIEIKKIEDDRGFFGRSWCRNEFIEHGLNADICQINTSFSLKKGTIRGTSLPGGSLAGNTSLSGAQGAGSMM